jgi:hypothetical protein
MPTRRTEPTHEADSPTQPKAATAQPRRSSPESARAEAGRMQGANGPLLQPDPDDTNPAGDQDIDTAGTDADPLTRPKAATARPRRSSL